MLANTYESASIFYLRRKKAYLDVRKRSKKSVPEKLDAFPFPRPVTEPRYHGKQKENRDQRRPALHGVWSEVTRADIQYNHACPMQANMVTHCPQSVARPAQSSDKDNHDHHA